jgi:hypothetical protein
MTCVCVCVRVCVCVCVCDILATTISWLLILLQSEANVSSLKIGSSLPTLTLALLTLCYRCLWISWQPQRLYNSNYLTSRRYTVTREVLFQGQ